ncbi:ribose-phosphate diphosphokinase [Chitinivibrio alkaliphilus]|uniref:Ribose-phosphate pyrophosphokinase n=1 Tax=Chitinivibrio alkaliphilus ACht1 TaxID=1313304 RepID=U7D6R5_9BACT|nr:ribose-phosphate pyrophosphokinase [Chitinivibrio alkaliphilus]ERP31628.1 ribose-phosphate pyrophosphokinase [Chitinivibrio alkaliphilus ACht1]
MFGELKIFSGRANPELTKAICATTGVMPGAVDIMKFSNENIKVAFKESVRGKDVYLIQPSCAPVNEGLMELLIMINAAKHASAGRITAVTPYFPYVRSDKKDEPRIAITAKLVADLIQTAGADRIMTMNLHSAQIQGFFDIPCDHLLAGKILCDAATRFDTTNGVVVAPDAGSAKHAGHYARRLNLPLAILDKRRSDDSEAPSMENIIGEVEGKKAFIFDDEVASGGSLIEAAEMLEKKGATEIIAFCVHGVLSGNARERIEQSCIKKLVVTDTVCIPQEKRHEKLEIVSVAELFGKAITYTNAGRSISGLYSKY